MTNQQDEKLFNKLKCLNEKNRVIALATINALFISEFTENEIESAVRELMSSIKQ